MSFATATEPGTATAPNEDWAGTAASASGATGTVVVVDGVTPPRDGDGCQHGVAWFAARLGATLLARADAERDASLTTCLASAVTETAETHRASCDLSHPRTPQATVVCARWDAATVEYLVLSDSVLLLGAPDGVVRPVLDDRLERLRPAARRLPPERRVAFVEGLRNAEGGFFTAAADPAVAARAVTGTVPRAGVRALAALTDGVGRWVEVFRLGGWPELFGLLAEEGPRAAVQQVRAAEAADPRGEAFPRGKAHDDATAVYAVLPPTA